MKKRTHLGNETAEILNAFKKYPQQSYDEVISNLISNLNDALTNNILFNALMDHLPASVYFKDCEGRHIKVCKATQKDYNEIYCKRLGLEPQDMIGKTDEELYPELAKMTFKDDIYVIESKKAIINREEHTPLDGRYFSTTKAPIFNEKGDVTGLVGITYDITAQKVIEQELQKTTKTLRNLNESLMVINTILRHDILNYLTQVLGFLDFYKMKRDEFYLERIYNPVQRAVSVINKLGELEKLVIQEEPLKTYNLREVSEIVLKNFSSSTIEFKIVGQGFVLADQALYSVIENLVGNAIIHSQTESIELRINETEDDYCELKVIDYGLGISDSIKKELFQPGQKFGKTGGTGYGLYIVKKIIERYGGEVSVEDNLPKGTIFSVKLKKTNPD